MLMCYITDSTCFILCRILYENLTGMDIKSTRSVTGVQMVGVIVANGFLPYRDDETVSRDRWEIVCFITVCSYGRWQDLGQNREVSSLTGLGPLLDPIVRHHSSLFGHVA